jgi:hypothetical protein
VSSNVPVPQATCDEAVLPERVQEALGQLVGAAKEGLLALSVGVGLGVLTELRCSPSAGETPASLGSRFAIPFKCSPGDSTPPGLLAVIGLMPWRWRRPRVRARPPLSGIGRRSPSRRC